MKSKLTLFFFVLILIACSKPKSSTIVKNEILWDNYGIPHIYATSDSSLYYMAGWAQMKNHGNLILKLYGESRGVSAALWGERLETNLDMHELGIIDQLQTSFEQLKPQYQQMLRSFAAGVNSYAKKHSSQLDEKYLQVLPITAKDLIAHHFRVINYEFLIKLMISYNERKAGSNAWALSPKKTATGNAMLVANPHLWWEDLFIWHEQQFTTNEQNIYGATLVGLPAITIGFNENISWTHTVNPMDNTDFFRVKKKDSSYYLDGEYLPIEKFSYNLKLKKEDGTLETQERIRKKTKHGVVVKESEETLIAMRFAQMDNYTPYFEQYYLMGKAKNLDEFNKALSLRQMPFLNTLYADREGNIMHHFGGLIPKKNGDWAKWQDVVSGDSSANIWTEYYPSDALPTVVNPPGGWLQNANEPPYVNTIPRVLNSKDFASHITPDMEGMPLRPQRSARLLHENDSISFEELVILKHNSQAEFALRIQDDLQSLKEQSSDSLVLEAISTLTTWDASYNNESLGAIFFMEFINTWAAEKGVSSRGLLRTGFEEQWTIDDPIQTPDSFNDPNEIIEVLKLAAENHLKKYPALAVPYGDYYKLKMGDLVYPASGGLQSLGVFRILMSVPDNEKEHTYKGNFGDTFVLVVEMADKIKAKGLLSYGNSSNPESPHYGDQLELFSKNELRNVLFEREDQEKFLEEKEDINQMK